MTPRSRPLLRDIHPNLEAGSYRVVFPAKNLPTLEQAWQERLTGAAFIVFGVCFLSWRVWKWRRARQRNENQEWFAAVTSDQQVQSFDQSLTQFSRPSETMASLRSWIVWFSAPAFIVAGCFYFLSEIEIISEEVGLWGMGVTEASCLGVSPKFVTGVMDYAHWISGWSNIERGSAKKGVPLLPRAEQIVQQQQGRLMFAWRARPNGVVFANDRIEALRTAQANYAARSSSFAEQDACIPLVV